MSAYGLTRGIQARPSGTLNVLGCLERETATAGGVKVWFGVSTPTNVRVDHAEPSTVNHQYSEGEMRSVKCMALAGVCAAMLAVTGIGSGPSLTQAMAKETQCEDGYPRLGCKIWSVKITIGFPVNQVVCETGGEWQCSH